MKLELCLSKIVFLEQRVFPTISVLVLENQHFLKKSQLLLRRMLMSRKTTKCYYGNTCLTFKQLIRVIE